MKTKDGLSVGKKLIIAIAVIAVILLAAYFIIAIYFKSHVFPNTYIPVSYTHLCGFLCFMKIICVIRVILPLTVKCIL